MKNRFGQVVVPFSVISVGTLLLCGCQSALFTALFIIKGPDIDPQFKFLLKGNAKVVVVCRSMAANQYETQNVPREIARQVGDLIHNKSKNKKLKVVESTTVDAWLDNCDNIFNDFLDVGRAKSIAADYVIGIDLIGYQLRDPHSPHLLQGKARLQVRAFDCESGKPVANQTVEVVYPPSTPITAGPGVDQAFRPQFVEIVSEQIAILFVPHDPKKTKLWDARSLEMHRLD